MVTRISPGEKLKIFVSSKGHELRAERERVISAISEDMRFDAVFFEGFGARPGKPMDECLKEVRGSDFYIGIFWNQYSRPTEQEYKEAREGGKPCLIYIKNVDEPQRDKELSALLKEIEQSHFYSGFQTPKELASRVKEDLAREITRLIKQVRQNVVQGIEDGISTIKGLFQAYNLKDGVAAVNSLVDNLVKFAELHCRVFEWKELHDNLLALFDSFLQFFIEAKGDEVNIEYAYDMWQPSRKKIHTKLIPFTEDVTYIGDTYDVDGIPFVQKVAADIEKIQAGIDEALDEKSDPGIRRLAGELDYYLREYSGRTNVYLKDAATGMNFLPNELRKQIQTIEDLAARPGLPDSSMAVNKLVEGLEKLTEYQSCLSEWIELHDLLQGLDTSFAQFFIEVKRRGKIDIESAKDGWLPCRKQIEEGLVPFWKNVQLIGDAYEEDEDGKPCGGEPWLVSMVEMQRRIDQALETEFRKTLRRRTGELDYSIDIRLDQANKKLKETIGFINDLCTELRGRIQQ